MRWPRKDGKSPKRSVTTKLKRRNREYRESEKERLPRRFRLFFLIVGVIEITSSIYVLQYTPYYWLGAPFEALLLAGLGALAIAAGWKELIIATIIGQLIAVPLAAFTYPTPFSFNDSKSIADQWIKTSPKLLSQGIAKAVISWLGIPLNLGADYLAQQIEPYLKDLFHWQYLLTVEGSVDVWFESWSSRPGRVDMITIRLAPAFSGYIVEGCNSGGSTLAEVLNCRVVPLSGPTPREITGRIVYANFTALRTWLPLFVDQNKIGTQQVKIGSLSHAGSYAYPPYAVRHVHYYLVTLNLPVIDKAVNMIIAIEVGGGSSLFSMISGKPNKVTVVVLQKLLLGSMIIYAGNGIGWADPGIVLYSSP